MDIKERILHSNLYDLYGDLLTEKQKDMIKFYLFDNLSMQEIADNEKISRQAVKSNLDTAFNYLNDLEKKLQLYALKNDLKLRLKEILNISSISDIKSKINGILEDL